MLQPIRLSAAGLAALLAFGAVALAPLARAEDINASLDGFIKPQYGAFDRHGPADNVRLDGDAHLDLSLTSDTGIQYGARVQLLRAYKPRDNGTYLSAAAAWGEVRLGDDAGASKELMVSAPTIGIGQIDGDSDAFGAPSALLVPYKLDNDDSTRLTYLSPEILGIRLGLSYAPELASAGVEIVPARPPMGADAHRNVGEIAAGYTRDVGAATLTAGAAYAVGGTKDGSRLNDLSGFGLGARLAWNGFIIGGGYVYDGAHTLPLDRRPGHALIDSVTDEVNFGITYETGDWGFGASWAHDSRAALSATDLVAAGLSYRVAKGFTVGADGVRFTAPKGPGAAEGYGLLLQASYRFGFGLPSF